MYLSCVDEIESWVLTWFHAVTFFATASMDVLFASNLLS